MARRTKRAIRCRADQQRFTVVQVGPDPYDSHAGRSFEAAYALANPDRGSRIRVYRTCATDGGAARLPSTYKKYGVLVRSFKSKR